jgi:hypothetical protein
MVRIIPVVAACALWQAAAAQPIYKCSAAGKLSYGDQPCTRGETVELAVPAAPAGAPAALERGKRERATLAQIEKLRLERELRAEREDARARRAAATQFHKCERLRLQRKWADEDLARSAGPATDKARLKARRRAEALAVECPA